MKDLKIAAEQPASWFNRAGFWMVRGTLGPVSRLLFRIRVENPPAIDGGYVVVANHTSFLDPLLLSSVSSRRITFLMTVAVFRSATLGWFYRWMRAIPLALRGTGNRDALRAARAVLDRGEVLGVFPEGGISRDGELLLGNPGAVSMALNSGAPLVPVHIDGADDAMAPGRGLPRLGGRIRIRFGQPLAGEELTAGLDSGAGRRAKLNHATERIMAEIASLGGVVSREVRLNELRSRRVVSSSVAAATAGD